MTKKNSMPAIPANWTRYIKSHAGKYAYGMFAQEDAEQVASEAFIKAQKHYVPRKGSFDHYARVAIRNALLNARRAEQRHWDNREKLEEDGRVPDCALAWAGEDELLDSLDKAETGRSVSRWASGLPPKLATLWQGLYARDMSQRDLAAKAGVSQACISQRNGKLLEHARETLRGMIG